MEMTAIVVVGVIGFLLGRLSSLEIPEVVGTTLTSWESALRQEERRGAYFTLAAQIGLLAPHPEISAFRILTGAEFTEDTPSAREAWNQVAEQHAARARLREVG